MNAIYILSFHAGGQAECRRHHQGCISPAWFCVVCTSGTVAEPSWIVPKCYLTEIAKVDGVSHRDMPRLLLGSVPLKGRIVPSQVVALDAPIEIRQAAAVNFKNHVKFNWVSNAPYCKSYTPDAACPCAFV